MVFKERRKKYNQINTLLNIPKSTLSTWFKNYPLSRVIKKRNILKTKIIWARNITNFNKKRSQILKVEHNKLINSYAKEIPKLNKERLFWIGLGLFWAEGGKKEKSAVRFSNSDPKIIQLIMRFFIEICKIDNSVFKFRIHLHPNIEKEKTQKFWAKILKAKKQQFYRPQIVISKSSKKKRKHNTLLYGTLHIYIKKVESMRKLKGWIKGLSLKI